MVHASSLNRPACVLLDCYATAPGCLARYAYTCCSNRQPFTLHGTLKNKKQAKTLRGRKDTLALVYFYWRGDRPPRPLGIDATAQCSYVLRVHGNSRTLWTEKSSAAIDTDSIRLFIFSIPVRGKAPQGRGEFSTCLTFIVLAVKLIILLAASVRLTFA